MIIDSNSERPVISYPCDWTYTIIAKDPLKVEKIAEEILAPHDYKILPSRSSRKGSYYSFKIIVKVPDEKTKDIIFSLFENNEAITLVL
jgi:putative lipoic acid-binding regulatory protein